MLTVCEDSYGADPYETHKALYNQVEKIRDIQKGTSACFFLG